MAKPSTNRHEQLEQLRAAEVKERTAARDTETKAAAAQAEADQARQELVQAHAGNGNVQAAEKRREQAIAQAEDAAIVAEASVLRVERARQARTEYEQQNASVLIDELGPAASDAVARLTKARDDLLAAGAEWADLSGRVGALVAQVPGASPRADTPATHGLENVVGAAKDTRDVAARSPMPTWAGIKAFEEEQHEARRAQVRRLEERKPRTPEEEGKLRRLLQDLAGRAAA